MGIKLIGFTLFSAVVGLIMVIIGMNIFVPTKYQVSNPTLNLGPDTERFFELDAKSGNILNFSNEADIIVASNEVFDLEQEGKPPIIAQPYLSSFVTDKLSYRFKSDLTTVQRGDVVVKNGEVHVWVISHDIVTVEKSLTADMKSNTVDSLFWGWLLINAVAGFLVFIL